MGGHPLPSLNLPQCLLGGPQVFAIFGCCSLAVVVGLPLIRFIVVSRFSVRRSPVESAATLLGCTGFPVVMRALVLGHSLP